MPSGLKTQKVGLEEIRSRKAVDPIKEVLICQPNAKPIRTNAGIVERLRAGHTSAVTRATDLVANQSHQFVGKKIIELSRYPIWFLYV